MLLLHEPTTLAPTESNIGISLRTGFVEIDYYWKLFEMAMLIGDKAKDVGSGLVRDHFVVRFCCCCSICCS